jgi:hypothetical protein
MPKDGYVCAVASGPGVARPGDPWRPLDGASYPCRILGDFDLAGISGFEYKKAGGCEIARRQ